MLSPRLVAVFALLATAAAVPATDRPAVPSPITTVYTEDVESPWFSFPLFGNLFAPLWKLFPSFADIGPKIIADDDKFQVIVNVKDYKKDDLKVKVKGDFIFIQGSHEAKQDDRDIFASQFFHTYTLPSNASASDVAADMSSDGFLIVTAPVTGKFDRSKEVDREVPIIDTGKPYKEEQDDQAEKSTVAPSTAAASPTVAASTTAAPVPTTVADVEDKKEATTPAEPEDITVKDNVIPHGNEIQP